MLVLKALLVLKAPWVFLVLLALKALLVLQVQWGRPVRKGIGGRPATKVLKALLVRKDLQVTPELQARQGHKGLMVILAQQGHKGHKASLGLKVRRDFPALKVLKALLALQALKVQ